MNFILSNVIENLDNFLRFKSTLYREIHLDSPTPILGKFSNMNSIDIN